MFEIRNPKQIQLFKFVSNIRASIFGFKQKEDYFLDIVK